LTDKVTGDSNQSDLVLDIGKAINLIMLWTINLQVFISLDQLKGSTIQTFILQFQMSKYQNALPKISLLFGLLHQIQKSKEMQL